MKTFSRAIAAALLAVSLGAVGVGAQGEANTPYKLGMFESDARTFMGPGTRTFPGLVIRDHLVYDLTRIEGMPKTLREILANWTPALAEKLQKAANDNRNQPQAGSYPVDEVNTLSPLADPANPALANIGLWVPQAKPAAAPAAAAARPARK